MAFRGSMNGNCGLMFSRHIVVSEICMGCRDIARSRLAFSRKEDLNMQW